jgi:hypothetical protein
MKDESSSSARATLPWGTVAFLGVDDFLDGSDGWFGCSHAGRPIKYRSHIDGAEISGECSCIIWFLPSRGSDEPSKRTGSYP